MSLFLLSSSDWTSSVLTVLFNLELYSFKRQPPTAVTTEAGDILAVQRADSHDL